ncbi:SCO2322 family protein [Streptomyces sp. NPDC089799]|uniref:SCO2322 family protein n=1 Tax=Streptomyces sp. NPDC089799 TaxID=3155066 RepID=UPI003435A40F
MRRATSAAALLLAAVLAVLVAAPAHAAGYRYWSFWDGTGDGGWTYATQGPSLARPADGSVQGFRFVVSADASAEVAKPRAAADFAAVCGSTPAAAGRKRVAVVVDFGLPSDAPAGETPPQDAPRTACAVLDRAGTAAEALASVAKPLRYNSAALLCAISGYPRSGCGEQVADTAGTSAKTTDPASSPAAAQGSPAPATDPTAHSTSNSASDSASGSAGSGPSVGLLAGIAAILAVGAAAVLQSRRRTR